MPCGRHCQTAKHIVCITITKFPSSATQLFGASALFEILTFRVNVFFSAVKTRSLTGAYITYELTNSWPRMPLHHSSKTYRALLSVVVLNALQGGIILEYRRMTAQLSSLNILEVLFQQNAVQDCSSYLKSLQKSRSIFLRSCLLCRLRALSIRPSVQKI